MSDVVEIGYSIDPSGYITGVNQIDQANQRLQGSTAAVITSTSAMQKAMSFVTPSRAAAAGMLLLAQQSATAEQRLSGLEARTQTSGANFDKLSKTVRSLATDMPIGQRGSLELIETITKMGVASEGSEKKIASLAKISGNLAGATGEGLGTTARSLIEFSRATGNLNLDTKRVSDIADSFATLEAKSGASAVATQQFAKTIAPMAQAAGLGQQSIAGISASMAKMGEDGIGAQTVISKMLGDINKAVRDGGPQIKTYADLAGMTADNFERLYKASPERAIERVTNAVAQAGHGGPRMLERIGIEGVRGQRIMQGLAAQGGFQSAIDVAMEGYGSGASQKAAETAYSGLSDTLTKTRESAGQLAEAMGRPLLTPLSEFSEAVGGATKVVADIMGSKTMQTLMTVGLGGAGLAFGAKALAAPVGTIALGRQLLTSGPLRALAGGWADARGLDPATSRIARFGQDMLGHYNDGSIMVDADGKPVASRADASWMSRFNMGAVELGFGAGAEAGPAGESGSRRSRLHDLRRRTTGAGLMGTSLLANMATLQVQDSYTTDPLDRNKGMLPFTGDRGKFAWEQAQSARTRGGVAGAWQSTAAYIKALDTESKERVTFGDRLRSVNKAFVNLEGGLNPRSSADLKSSLKDFSTEMRVATKATSAYTQAAGAVLRAGGTITGAAARDAMSLTKVGAKTLATGALSAIGGPTALALMGGAAALAIGSKVRSGQEAAREERANYINEDVYASINAYRDRAGMAAQSKTYAELNKAQDDALTQEARNRGWSATKRVSQDDLNAGATPRENVVNYRGTAQEVAAQIVTQNQQGLTPEELQQIKLDLVSQFDADQVQRILGYLPDELEAGGAMVSRDEYRKQMQYAVRGLTPKPLSGDELVYARQRGWYEGAGFSEDDEKMAKAFVAGVRQRESDSTGTAEFKFQETARSYNEMVKSAYETGNLDAATKYTEIIANTMDKGLEGETWTAQDLQKYEGNVINLIASRSPSVQRRLNAALAAGATVSAGSTGGILETIERSTASRQIAAESSFLGNIFGGPVGPQQPDRLSRAQVLLGGGANDPGFLARPTEEKTFAQARSYAAMRDFLASPDSTEKQNEATAAVISGAREAEMSMVDLAKAALNASTKVDASGDEFAALTRIFSRAQTIMSGEDIMYGDSSRTRREQLELLGTAATMDATTPEQQQQKEQAIEQIFSTTEGFKQEMVARLQVQRDYEKQISRSNRDFNLNQSRSQYDFNLQMTRAEEDFGRNRWRTQRDYNIQMTRSERDFGIQRARAQQEFQIGVARAERDYNIQRSRSVEDFGRQERRTLEDFRISTSRAIRDFGISLKRQLEDAAKSMVSAFSRIQAKPTWDANALSGNIQEQAEAMREQTANLARLRKAGLSSTAIRQLDLTSFDNHQQVRQLVNDISPEIIKQLNSSVSAKEAAARSLFQDKDNTALARSKEDFERSMKDQEADLRKSLARGRDDFNRSLTRGRDDFRRSMSDQRSDFNRSMKHQASDFTRSLKDQNKDFKTALADQRREFGISQSRQRTDFNTSMKRQWSDFRTQLSDMNRDIRDADKKIGGTLTELTRQYNKAIHGQTVNWGKIIKTDSKNLARDMNREVVPLFREVFASLGINQKDISKLAGSGGTQMGRNSYGTNIPLAEGGPVPGWSPHPKADNIPALLTAGEYVTNVDATKHYGIDIMHKINNKMIDRDELVRLASADKGRRVDSVGDVALLPGDGVLRRANGGYTYPSMVAWTRQNIPGAIITSTKRNWGTGSYHDSGKAIDIDGSTSFLRDAARKIVKTFGNAITELIHNPHTSIKHGKHVPPSYWGAGTWALHGGANEHLHWAMASMGKGSPLLGLPLVDGGGGLIDTSRIEAAFDKLGKKNTSPIYQMLLGKIRTASMDNLEQLAGEAGFNSSGTGVDRWKGVVLQALRIMNQPQSLLGSVLRRMNQESSGNPSVVNRWDSNWHAGTPSVGLMQVIGPTYRAHKHPRYDKGPYLYGVSTNPLANTLASMRYAMGRYGSLTSAYNRAGGYDDGGVIHPGSTLVQNDSGKPEALLNNQQWSDIHHLATLAGQMITKTDLQGIKASHGAPITINNNQKITYDQRNDFSDAKITVQSNDPDEMARKLEERQRRSRLTATRGVQRRD